MAQNSKNFKIVLANPAVTREMKDYYDTEYPSLGLLYIAGYLRKFIKNIEIKYIEGDQFIDEHLKIIEIFNPDLYGIYMSSVIHPMAYKTIEAVRNKFPELPIISGGPFSTVAPEDILNNSSVDICVTGEGEDTAVEVVNYFINKKNKLKNIKGIAFREKGKIIRTKNRPLIKDLDSVPFPAWDLVDFNNYLGMQIRKVKPPGHLLVSRGCPFDCVFCSNPVWKLQKPWLRLRSPKNIAEEIKLIYERGARDIFVRADEFNCSLKWAIEVCNEIKKLNLGKALFHFNIRADKVNEEFARALKDINCWLVHIGIESGNQRVLDGSDKKITLKQVVDACEIFKKYKIKVYGFFMMYQVWEENGKLCFETPEEVDNTIKFIKILKRRGLIHYISWAFTSPCQGARLFDIAKKHNILTENSQSRLAFEININLPGISRKTMLRHRTRGMLLQAYLALRSGNIEWKMWGRVIAKLKYILRIT